MGRWRQRETERDIWEGSSVVLSPLAGPSSRQKVDGKWKTVVCQTVKPVAIPGRPDRDLNLEKYSPKIEISPKKKKKKKKKAVLEEWVDNSYIKNYTDYETLKVLLEETERKYPSISEW